jgi:hypothetical protein
MNQDTDTTPKPQIKPTTSNVHAHAYHVLLPSGNVVHVWFEWDHSRLPQPGHRGWTYALCDRLMTRADLLEYVILRKRMIDDVAQTLGFRPRQLGDIQAVLQQMRPLAGVKA